MRNVQKKRVRAIARAKDPEKLFRVIRPLIGQKCWKVAFSYGRELCLHFGRRIRCDHPKLADEIEGEWIFCTRGTAWNLSASRRFVSSEERDEGRLEKRIKILEMSRVNRLALSYPDHAFSIKFGNDSVFNVVPTAGDDKYELPYWELFMPDHFVVAFGPGNHWSCKRSDVHS